MLERGLREHGLAVTHFTWRTALLGKYDVFHVHWPETLLQRRTRVGRILTRLLFAVLILRIAVTRVRVVRTAHNLSPHEATGDLDALLATCLERLTTVTIVMNLCDLNGNGSGSRVLIPHPDYRDWYALEAVAPKLGTIVCFGLLREYKGLESLIMAYRHATTLSKELIIAGMPKPQEYGERLVQLAESDPRIEVRAEHVSDAGLISLLAESHAVVLPYRRIHNSGALLLALSARRPVLVPRTATTEEISAEVGPGWVHFIEGEEVAAQDLTRLAQSDLPEDGPRLDRRRAQAFIEAHLNLYESMDPKRRKQ